MPKPSTPNSHKSTPSGSTARQDSSQASFYEAVEILAKKGNKYKVAWAGINPATGKQWEPSWVQPPVCVQQELTAGTEGELQRAFACYLDREAAGKDSDQQSEK